GKNVILPIVGRKIPIVADSYADPEQGSGAVKITPAHDFNDFEVGRRCNLNSINILDKTACIELNEDDFSDMESRDSWQGLERFEARKRVIDEITELGLLDKIEDNTHMVPFGDRSDVVIEPWLTDQWYVDAATLAKPAIEAVKSGQTKFVPANWEKTYFDWMENIQPWCISRQLWWGHQIPAWYGPDGEVFVAESEQDAYVAAKTRYGHDTELTRDEDVLDTWFSSALWPFSTLGWPDDTPELHKHYKTDVLVTGFDIIFFWVARMMMMGLHFKQEVPFHTVYIHALVRDEKGAKMSKSKGNVIDPLELADKYSADALRFTLSAMAAMGRDIKLSESRVEGYRNFATKLRNATRFCEINECFTAGAFNPAEATLPLTQWLVGETYRATEAITASLEAYRFNDASTSVYQFIWDGFCDWFIELAKPILQGDDEAAKIETQAAAQWGLQNALKLLHPFMPYVTEELWQEIKPVDTGAKFLMLENWPQIPENLMNKDADAEINWVIKAITSIRSVRSEMNVPAGAKIPLIVSGSNELTQQRIVRHNDVLKRLARLDTITVQNDFPEGSIQSIVEEAVFAIHLNEVIDVTAETHRLKKEITKVEKEISKISGKLNNQGFLEKAPDAVIQENKSRLQDEQSKLEKLETALDRLS
ncbi:MAG: valine--tRNA ligase, partial [Candidatus Micropelagos thuwalensis]